MTTLIDMVTPGQPIRLTSWLVVTLMVTIKMAAMVQEAQGSIRPSAAQSKCNAPKDPRLKWTVTHSHHTKHMASMVEVMFRDRLHLCLPTQTQTTQPQAGQMGVIDQAFPPPFWRLSLTRPSFACLAMLLQFQFKWTILRPQERLTKRGNVTQRHRLVTDARKRLSKKRISASFRSLEMKDSRWCIILTTSFGSATFTKRSGIG